MFQNFFRKISFFIFFLAIGDNFAESNNFEGNQWISKRVYTTTSQGKIVFEIHGPKNHLIYLNKVAEVLKTKSRPLLEYFAYSPTNPIQFILVPEESHFNGSAQIFPYPLIYLNLFPPFGNDHNMDGTNGIEGLVLHELTHVAHLDQSAGFLKGLRHIFGTFLALVNSLSPRWLTEGIAVWAETEFTLGGRLRQELALWEAHFHLLDRSLCSTIDCIDEPGRYPYASYPYWIGPLFLNEREQEKPGFLACLVKASSEQLPFLLNRAYQRCLRDKNQRRADMSVDFRKFISKKRRLLEESSEKFKKKMAESYHEFQAFYPGSFGSPILRKNFQFGRGKLFFMADQRKTPVGIIRDMESVGAREYVLPLPFHVDQVASASKSHVLLSTSTRDRLSRPRQIAWVNLENNQIEKTLKLERGADYPFQASSALYFFRYLEDAWHLYRMREWGEEEEILKFPRLAGVSRIHWSEQEDGVMIYLLLYDSYQKYPYQLLSLDGDGKNLSILYQDQKPFDFLGECENEFFLRQGKGLTYLRKKDFQNVIAQKNENFLAKQIIQMRWNRYGAVFLMKDDPRQMYYLEKECREISDYLKRGGEKFQIELKKTKKMKWASRKVSMEGVRSYASSSYLRPYWWFLNYSSEGESSYLKIQTSLQDPALKHFFDLSLDHYFHFNKQGLEGDYQYSLYKNMNYFDPNLKFFLSGGYKHSYLIRDSSQKKIYVGLRGVFKTLYYNYSFFIGRDKKWGYEDDFFSYFFHQSFKRAGIFSRDFWTSLELGHHLTYHFEKEYRRSWSSIIYTKNTFQPLRGLYFHLWGGHGKRFQGGSNSLNFKGGGIGNKFFPFYGIEKGEATGNNIQAYRLELDLEWLRIYRSPGENIPFYFKKLNGLMGASYLKADEEFSEYYYGARLSATLLHRIPFHLDVIMNKLNKRLRDNRFIPFVIIKSSFSF